MATIVVWVCILWTGNGPVVIDGIATERNCLGLISAYSQGRGLSGRCIAVRKVRP